MKKKLYDDEEEYKTRENYMTEVRKSLKELSKADYCDLLEKIEWDGWGPVGCMECGSEENISVKYFALSGELEPLTVEEENMLRAAVEELSKTSGIDKSGFGRMFTGDYLVIDIPTCGKCGSHSIFSDF